MQTIYRISFALATIAMFQTSALADKFDACPDPASARRYVKACLQENPYNTQETCEARALEKLCGAN
jgi:hypothetical protein